MAVNSVLTSTAGLVTGGPTTGKQESVRLIQATSFSERIDRVKVGGVGLFAPLEYPALEWSGEFSCETLVLDFIEHPISQAVYRNFATDQEFADYHVFGGDSCVIQFFHRQGTVDADLRTVTNRSNKPIAYILDARWITDGMTLPGYGLASRSTSFLFTNPILTARQAAEIAAA